MSTPLPRLIVEYVGDLAAVAVRDSEICSDGDVQAIGDELYALVGQQGCRSVTLDLSTVVRLYSAFLGKLIVLNHRLHAAGGRLTVRGVHCEIVELFELCGLRRLFQVERGERAREGSPASAGGRRPSAAPSVPDQGPWPLVVETVPANTGEQE